jgi:hypothetical protein
MKTKIALIFHENEPQHNIRLFAIWHLAEVWRKENVDVVVLFGTGKHIDADLAILHVDLSVVPPIYADFAGRYPVVLNRHITDIRKSSFSKLRVNLNDGYEGRIIVKSDMNYAGQPERKLLGTALSRLAFRISLRLPHRRAERGEQEPNFKSPLDYMIRDSSQVIPQSWFSRGDILIEKFVPEIQEGLFCQRVYHFLGDRGVCILRKSKNPIINASNAVSRTQVDVHPEIVALARRLNFDYGKFDYVLRDGEPLLLDANKTPGAVDSPAYYELCREWAKGIHFYL